MIKRPVPGYVEEAMFRLRGNGNYIKWLCEAYPDTMRWISHTINQHLLNMRNAEIQRLNGGHNETHGC